jgi:predicted small secreted protein
LSHFKPPTDDADKPPPDQPRKDIVKKTHLVLPLLLLAAALALAACGGSSGGGEEAKVEEAIEESATSTDPSKCTEFQTAAFNENESGQKGAEATKTCEEEAKENDTESVKVSNVSVDGEKATAEVEVEGSGLNGQGVELELIEEDGNWKLDKFLGFTHFDAAALGEALEEEFAKEEGVEPKLAKCVSEGVAELSQSDAESMVFEKDLKPVEEIAESCQ